MRTALKIFNKGNEHFRTAMPAFAKKKLGIEIEEGYLEVWQMAQDVADGKEPIHA